jgi:hypothetical protein
MPCITKSLPLVRGTSFVYRFPSLLRRGNTTPISESVRNVSYELIEEDTCGQSARTLRTSADNTLAPQSGVE